MPSLKPRFAPSIVAAVAFVVALSLGTPAFAGQTLLEELPEGHDTVVLIDFSQMRGSPLYGQAFDMLSEQRELARFMDYLSDDLEIDIRDDVSAVAVASDSPPLSGDMLQQPLGAVGAAGSSDGSLILVRGAFDAAEVIEKVADDADEEVTNNRVRTDTGELRVVDEKTLAMVVGTSEFIDTASSRLDGSRSGPGAAFTRGISELGASQGIYAMVRPTIEDSADLDAEPTFTALSVDMKNEVRIGVLLQLGSEEEAEEMVKDIDDLRKQAGNNPLTAMLGARPLVDNLSIQQNGSQFVMRSSMTNDETLRLVRQVYNLTRSSRDLSRPIQGDRLDGDDSDSSKPSRDGVDADFN